MANVHGIWIGIHQAEYRKYEAAVPFKTSTASGKNRLPHKQIILLIDALIYLVKLASG